MSLIISLCFSSIQIWLLLSSFLDIKVFYLLLIGNWNGWICFWFSEIRQRFPVFFLLIIFTVHRKLIKICLKFLYLISKGDLFDYFLGHLGFLIRWWRQFYGWKTRFFDWSIKFRGDLELFLRLLIWFLGHLGFIIKSWFIISFIWFQIRSSRWPRSRQLNFTT